jgi:precorrin-2/cobalt-factor-2 C20-methyltransferase
MTKGIFHGVGLGPGDPELVTVKAVRLIESCGALAWFAKAGRRGNARTIVDRWVPAGKPELPLFYPMTTETHFGEEAYIAALSGFYEESVARIAAVLDEGRDVVLACEGDPMFYRSEERRVGKECRRLCRSRWSPYH